MRNILRFLAVVLLVEAVAPGVAAAGWVRITTEHFVVYGDTPRSARTAAERMEAFHGALIRISSAPLPDRPAARVPILAFADGPSFLPFAPLDENGRPNKRIGGLHTSRPGLTLIALSISSGASMIVQHEYVHQVLHDVGASMPAWFDEGMAEYYAAAVVENGQRVQLGTPLPYSLRILRERKWIPLERLFAVEHDAEEYVDNDVKSLFYAQSWLLVHYCLADPDQRRPAQLAALLTRLDAGETAEAAVRGAFGTSIAELGRALDSYASGLNLPIRTLTLPEPLPRLRVKPVPVDDAELDAHLGLLLALVGRHEEAESRLARSIDAGSDQPLAWEARGWAAVERDDAPAAHAAFARAVADGSSSASARFGFAISADGLAPVSAVRAALEEALTLDSDLVEVYPMLVDLALEEGDLAASDRWLEQGLAADPRSIELRIDLARAQLRNGRPEHARTTLETLLARSRDPETRERLSAMLTELPAPSPR